MMEKSKSSMLLSVSKQLTKMASTVSNSEEANLKGPAIDDVPLNQTVAVVEKSKKTSTSRPSKKVSPAPTTVIGNKDLKLKVTHNDAGRVVISLSNSEKVLVQVHVDESVLKSKGGALKKKTKRDEKDKELPKKKSHTVAKATKKTAVAVAPNSKIKMTRENNEPRDLPDEQSSSRRDKAKYKREEISSSRERTIKISSVVTSHVSSTVSVTSHGSIQSDDSTRSPKDLNRGATPKTPRVQKGIALLGDTPTTEPDMDDYITMPSCDIRRQKGKLRQDPAVAPGTSTADSVQLHDLMETGTEAKMEETVDDQSGFSSPMKHRRLQHRQKRMERQRSQSEIFRSTRSIRSRSPPRTGNIPPSTLDPPSIEWDASTNKTPDSFPPIVVENKRQQSNNRALHIRPPPHQDDDDDSATSNNRRIRKKLDEVGTNKGDGRSGPLFLCKEQEAQEMEETQFGGTTGRKVVKLFSKLCKKVNIKHQRKDHQKL